MCKVVSVINEKMQICFMVIVTRKEKTIMRNQGPKQYNFEGGLFMKKECLKNRSWKVEIILRRQS